MSFTAQGMVVKNAAGDFEPRMGWTNFTQEALKEIVKNPKAKTFVEPFIEEAMIAAKCQVTRPRYAGRTGALRLLVVGGSLGAQTLNDLIVAAIAAMPEQAHQTLSLPLDYRSRLAQGDVDIVIGN